MSKRREQGPKTVEEAVDQLVSSMPEEDKATLKHTPEGNYAEVEGIIKDPGVDSVMITTEERG
jgi:hypothetical protein